MSAQDTTSGVLSLIGLKKRFGDVVALDGTGFEVRPGRIVGFLGPNGAGKTTAMRCIFGLVRPDSGEVLWNGRPVGHGDRLCFGYMPEERGLYPKMRLREQLAYLARLSGMGRKVALEAVDAWLDRMGLGDRASSRLEELSHGNQQRVQLAASLIHDPELAVLDEPFGGLDPIGVEALAEVLRELANRGTAIVFSSHQLDLVEDVCEDVVIIDHGRVVMAGILEELRAASNHRHLSISVDGRPWVPDLPGIVQVENGRGSPRYLVARDAPIGDLLARARTVGEVTGFTFEPPRLTDLFREAVGR
ncbi:MAG: ATP-binding cassette domain-containing protein [Actinomycetota bacterium]